MPSVDTGYSSLWNDVYKSPHQLLSTTAKPGYQYKRLSTAYGRRLYDMGALGAVIYQLAGGSPGGAVLKTHKRVKATRVLDTPSQGGLVEIETYNDINRVSVSDDAAAIQAAITVTTSPTYPVDASGNGGGNKLGF